MAAVWAAGGAYEVDALKRCSRETRRRFGCAHFHFCVRVCWEVVSTSDKDVRSGLHRLAVRMVPQLLAPAFGTLRTLFANVFVVDAILTRKARYLVLFLIFFVVLLLVIILALAAPGLLALLVAFPLVLFVFLHTPTVRDRLP